MQIRRKDDAAQRLLEEYLEYLDQNRSDVSTFAGSGVVVLDVMYYRLHVPAPQFPPETFEAPAAM